MADPSSLLKTGVVGAALKLMLNSFVLLMLLLLLLLRVCVFDRYINLSALLLFFYVFAIECFVSWKKISIYIYLVVVVVELLEVELLAFAALCSSPSTARPRCPAVGLD